MKTVESVVSKPLILCVEDDPLCQLLLERALKEGGFAAHFASDGKIALDKLKANKDISICLLDLNMPIMDGYSFLTKIVGDPRYDSLKVYITSCNSKNDFFEQTDQKNIDTRHVRGYFQKPFLFNEMIQKLYLDIANAVK